MSSVSTIIAKTAELVKSLDELFATDTAGSLPGVASQLGIADTFNHGVSLLAALLGQLDAQLGRVEVAIEQLDGLGGLLGLLEPLVAAMGKMVGDTGSELASYGLEEVVSVTGPIRNGFRYAEQTLKIASTIVVDATSFGELRSSLARLVTTVAAMHSGPQQVTA